MQRIAETIKIRDAELRNRRLNPHPLDLKTIDDTARLWILQQCIDGYHEATQDDIRRAYDVAITMYEDGLRRRP